MSENYQGYYPQQDGRVLNAETKTECENEENRHGHHGYKGETIKVPKVLAEPMVQIPVEATIELDDPAIEIKRIKKDVVLEQCKLVPTEYKGHKFVKEGKLYLAGYVRKNIEYATAADDNATAVDGNIQHTTVHVPFSCVSEVEFHKGSLPVLWNSNTDEYRFLDENGLGPRLDKNLFRNRVYYNEQPYCELVFAEFHELDLGQSLQPLDDIDNENTFTTFIEKMVLELKVKVLQLQQVDINQCYDDHYNSKYDKYDGYNKGNREGYNRMTGYKVSPKGRKTRRKKHY